MYSKNFMFTLLAITVDVSSTFSLPAWGAEWNSKQQQQQQSMPVVHQPLINARTGTQWGRPRPIRLPCDGLPAITRACDEFCKSIRAAQGACVPIEQTCGCTGGSFVSAPSGPVSPQAPPEIGIHVVNAPDLSNQNSPTTEALPTVTSLPQIMEKRRSRRQALEKLVEGSGPKDPNNLCTKDSCKVTCAKHGYASCDAECVGRSCYCNCPSIDKPLTQAGRNLNGV